MSESYALWIDFGVDAVAWLLVHATWLGCVCAAGAWFSMRLLRSSSAAIQHAGLCGWLFLIPLGVVVLTLWPSPAAVTEGLPAVPVASATPGISPANSAPPDSITPHVASTRNNLTAERATVTESGDSSDARSFGTLLDTCAPWLVGAWLCGVLVLSFRLLFGWQQIRRRLFGGSSPASERIQSLAAHVARQLGLPRTVRVLEAVGAEVPITIGFLRPVIFLPVSIATSLTPLEMEAILAHELAHIRRHDFVINLVQTILETLLFYHPAVWWLSARIREQREHACDDIAITVTGDRLQYARVLTEVAAQTRTYPLSLAATGSDLRHRVRRIVGLPPVQVNRSVSLWSGTMLLCGMIIPALLVAAGMALKSPAVAQTSTAEPNSSQTAEPAVAGDSTFKPVAGLVVGPDSRPLAGATVHLRRRPGRSDSDLLLGTTTTNSRGRFRFAGIQKPPFYQVPRPYPQDVIVTKPGHMIRWQLLNAARDDIRIQLKKDTPFSAVLKDGSGDPVDNAEIRVANIMSLNTISKIDLAGGHFPSVFGASYLNVARSPVAITATTDQQGRFTLRGLPNRVGVELKLHDQRFALDIIYAATTKETLPTIPVRRSAHQPARDTVRQIVDGRPAVDRVPIHGLSSEIVVRRGTRLAVRVIDAETDDPVPGATVTGIRGASDRDADPVAVNENGTAHFHRISGQHFHVTVDAPVGTRLQSSAHTIPVPEGDRDQQFTIRMLRGVILSGRVTDAQTGEGIEGVVLYACHFENNALQQHQSASHQVAVPRVGQRVRTRSDGSYQVVASPDSNCIFVVRVPPGYSGPSYSGTIRLPAAPELVAGFEPTDPARLPGIDLQLEPTGRRIVRIVDELDRPVACRVTGQAETVLGGLSYREFEHNVTGDGTLNVAPHTDRGTSLASAIQLTARSRDNRLAAFFRSRHVEDLSDIPVNVIMKPVAAVRGQVIDAVTKQPVPRAVVSLLVRFTRQRGQEVARTACDQQGYFEFTSLIPDMEYSIGTKADQYKARNSIKDPFQTVAGTTHDMKIPLQPRKPPTGPDVAELTAITVPAWQELPPETALQLLRDEFETARRAFDQLLKEKDSPYPRDAIVKKREPTAAFTVAMMALAGSHPDSNIELEALKWVCQRSLVVGTEQRYAHLRPRAARRLLDKYADRAELADAAGSIIHSAPESYAAAEQLMASPHPAVQGQARFSAARLLANRYQYQGNDHRLYLEAIRLYKEVRTDYADLQRPSGQTLGEAAELALFQLEHLQDGQMAPEIEGTDLNGQPMKISDFHGQVVVIHYWHPAMPWFDRIVQMVEDYAGKPVVFVCINCDRDHPATHAGLGRLPRECRHLDDIGGEIRQRWSPGHPSTHVIGHDGRIVYLDHGRSQGSLEGALQRAVRAATSATHPAQ